jgi:hypothetical protein
LTSDEQASLSPAGKLRGYQLIPSPRILWQIWNSADECYSIDAFVENIEDEVVNARLNVGGNDFTQTSDLALGNTGVRFRARSY